MESGTHDLAPTTLCADDLFQLVMGHRYKTSNRLQSTMNNNILGIRVNKLISTPKAFWIFLWCQQVVHLCSVIIRKNIWKPVRLHIHNIIAIKINEVTFIKLHTTWLNLLEYSRHLSIWNWKLSDNFFFTYYFYCCSAYHDLSK